MKIRFELKKKPHTKPQYEPNNWMNNFPWEWISRSVLFVYHNLFFSISIFSFLSRYLPLPIAQSPHKRNFTRARTLHERIVPIVEHLLFYAHIIHLITIRIYGCEWNVLCLCVCSFIHNFSQSMQCVIQWMMLCQAHTNAHTSKN